MLLNHSLNIKKFMKSNYEYVSSVELHSKDMFLSEGEIWYIGDDECFIDNVECKMVSEKMIDVRFTLETDEYGNVNTYELTYSGDFTVFW